MKKTPFLPSLVVATAIAATGLLAVSTAQADTIYWDGATTSATLWSATTSWNTAQDGSGTDPAAAPGASDIAWFNTDGNNHNVIANLNVSSLDIGGLVITNSGGYTRIQQGDSTPRTITIGASGIDMQAGAKDLQFGNTSNRPLNVALAASQSWTNNSSAGEIVLRYSTTTATALDLGTFTLTVGGSGNTTINDPISGAGGGAITKTGTGTLNLIGANGANTYSGNTTISAGTVNIDVTDALPGFDTNGRFSVASGATLAVQNGVADVDIASMLGTTNFAAGANIGFDTSAGNRTYSVVLADTAQGALGLIKLGGNTLTLDQANTYTGGTTLFGGTVKVSNDSALGTGLITINGGGFTGVGGGVTIANDVNFAGDSTNNNVLTSSITFAGTVTGTGSLAYNGFANGTIGFSGSNSGWSGDIQANGNAMLRVGSATALGTGTLTFGTDITGLNLPSLSSSADLSGGSGVANNIVNNLAGTVLYLDNNLKLSGTISGSGSIRLGSGSTGILTLSGTNTYTGFTNLQAGTASVSSIGNGGANGNIGAASSAATNLVFSDATLQYTGAGETTDRLFTIGSASATYLTTGAPTVDLSATVTAKIDSSGTGALVFSNTGSLAVGNALNTVLELSGSNTGLNTLAAVIGNSTDSTPVTLDNSTTTSQTNGSANRQVIVTDTTGINVGDTVTGSGIPVGSTVVAVLGPTRIAIEGGSTEAHAGDVSLTFTNPDISANKTSLVKSGAGTWVLTGVNTFTGSTTINGGALAISADSGLGAAPGTATAGHLALNDGALATTATMTLASNRGIALEGTSGGQLNVATGTTLTYGGVAAGSKGLEKAGAGTLDLTGNSTYTGGTLVSEGTLLINGDNSAATGIVSVSSGAAIGGNGTIGGSLSLTSGAKFVFSLTDTLTVNGAGVAFGGFSVADLVGLTSGTADGIYTLINGTATIDFANVSNVGLGNAYDLGGGKSAYFQSGSLDLVVTAVPEPSAWALLGGGLAVVVILRRRRQMAA